MIKKIVTSTVLALVLMIFVASLSNAQTGPESLSENYTIGLAAYRLGDYAGAFNAWKLGAFENNVEAQYNLGVLYVEGRGASKDPKLALHWFLRAAGQQHPGAQYNLGHLYMVGSGVEVDEIEAMKWWRMSSDNGYPLAAYNLGRAYFSGVGGTVDLLKAKHWFQVAASQGEPRSQEFLILKAEALSELSVESTKQISLNEQAIDAEEVELKLVEEVGNIDEEKAAEDEVAEDDIQSEGVTLAETITEPIDVVQTKETVGMPSKLVAVQTPTTLGLAAEGESLGRLLVTPQRLVKVYADAAGSSTILMQLNPLTLLKAYETVARRIRVQRALGFPVWVESKQLHFDGASLLLLEREIDYSDEVGASAAGTLRAGEVVSLLREEDGWSKLLSPWSHTAWVDETDLADAFHHESLTKQWQSSLERRLLASSKSSSVVRVEQNTEQHSSAVVSVESVMIDTVTDQAQSKSSQSETQSEKTTAFADSSAGSLNDNGWLFNQQPDSHVIHLFSLTQWGKAQEAATASLFGDSAKLFSTQIRGDSWYFILQGPYSSKVLAEEAKQALPEQYRMNSRVRDVSVIAKNRCKKRLKLLPGQKDQLSIYCVN
ncbi:MAG: hypothetical protein ACI89S_002618 [Gammaproteobacteria bacterium]|jgi:hypothetical protein